jgi:general stress protein 26
VSRRSAIVMSAEEVLAFLDAERTLVCATIGRDGWPHLMPLWYVVRDGECWAWTYAKSQKVINLERESRCTIQVEAGEEYGQLRGVMMKCAAAIHRDLETVAGVGAEIAARYGGGATTPAVLEAMRGQAAKRVALQFVVNETSSWNHGKLSGLY